MRKAISLPLTFCISYLPADAPQHALAVVRSTARIACQEEQCSLACELCRNSVCFAAPGRGRDERADPGSGAEARDPHGTAGLRPRRRRVLAPPERTAAGGRATVTLAHTRLSARHAWPSPCLSVTPNLTIPVRQTWSSTLPPVRSHRSRTNPDPASGRSVSLLHSPGHDSPRAERSATRADGPGPRHAAGGERVVVQHGADGGDPHSRRTSSVALMSSASETWGCYADASELARRGL